MAGAALQRRSVVYPAEPVAHALDDAAAVRQCAVKDRENPSDDDTQLDETEEERSGFADCSGFTDDEWKGVRSNGRRWTAEVAFPMLASWLPCFPTTYLPTVCYRRDA